MEFKPGDKVKCIDVKGATSFLTYGAVYTVELAGLFLSLEEVQGGWQPERFEKVEEPPQQARDMCRGCPHIAEPECPSVCPPYPPPPPDFINEPPHYTGRGGIEPVDYIVSNNMNWLEGNIIKYLYRYPWKDGVVDLKKAQFYLNQLIKQEELRNDAVKQY